MDAACWKLDSDHIGIRLLGSEYVLSIKAAEELNEMLFQILIGEEESSSTSDYAELLCEAYRTGSSPKEEKLSDLSVDNLLERIGL